MESIFSCISRIRLSSVWPETLPPSSPQPAEADSASPSVPASEPSTLPPAAPSTPPPTPPPSLPPSLPSGEAIAGDLHPALKAASTSPFGKPATGWVLAHIKPTQDTIELIVGACYGPSDPGVGQAVTEFAVLVARLSERIFSGTRKDNDLANQIRMMGFTLNAVLHYAGGHPLFERFALVIFDNLSDMDVALATAQMHDVDDKMKAAIEANVAKTVGPLFDGFDTWFGEAWGPA